MKIRGLLLLFCLITVPTWAQVKVLLLRDSTQYNVSVANLEKQYPPAFPRVAGQKGVFMQHGRRFLDTTNARTLRFFTFIENNKKRMPVAGVFLQTKEFVRPDGTYERVFCQFEGRDLTAEQESQLLELLNEWYDQHPFPIKTQTGFRWDGMTQLGNMPQKRTVRRGAGIISTLEAAEKTTRPDTVRMLAFNQLELSSIPEIVYRFPKLEELDLSKNHLHELPARLTTDIPTLKRLSLLYNAIPNDSVFFTRNKHLVALNLQGNKLTQVPASVRQNRRLESLWIGNNKLQDVNVKGLRRLNDLNLYNAELARFPASVCKLKRLQVLDLYYNKFTEIPAQIRRLKRLEQLAIAYNELKGLPPSLGNLSRLQMLYAHHNRISQLPSQLQKLHYLRILDLSHNWFSVVPAVVADFPYLEELDFSNNNVQEMPAVLGKSKSLKKLYLRSNPLTRDNVKAGPYAPVIEQLEANQTEVFY